MKSEITLTLYDNQTGQERRVSVNSSRFTIGRLPENDLAIDDTNLSRRHALIESFDNSILISDCGSQNGTSVNGKPVVGAVVLQDGDLITLGGSTELTVSVRNGVAQAANTRSAVAPPSGVPPHLSTPVGGRSVTASGRGGARGGSAAPSWLNTPVIAAAVGVVILLIAGVLLLVSRGDKPGRRGRDSEREVVNRQRELPENTNDEPANVAPDNQNDNAPDGKETPEVSSGGGTETGGDDLGEVEKYALRVMTSISKDNNPNLSSKALAEINQKIKGYKGSAALRDGLRAIKQGGTERLAAAAKGSDLKPPLVVYAALAKMDRDGERGDPVAVGQSMLPTLSRLRGIFSTELANDALLVIAAYDQGPGGTTHPLQMTLFQLAQRQPDSPATIRTVWYLHEHQKISPQSYDLVLRFLAIGVIAQNPRKFGVEAEPLSF
jgi:hypothetical protein